MKKITLIALSVATLAVANTDQRPPEPLSADKIISQMDRNGDGRLSKDEAKGPLEKDFLKIDTNKDGYLSKAEIKKSAPKGEKRPPRQ